MANVKVQVRRAYEDPAQGDGTRVLAGRIWPRGLTKARRPVGGGERKGPGAPGLRGPGAGRRHSGAGRPDLAARADQGQAAVDEWCKEIAPSTELRKWHGHDPERFGEFGRRYQAELAEPERAGALAHLRELASGRGVTLLTATRQAEISEERKSGV